VLYNPCLLNIHAFCQLLGTEKDVSAFRMFVVVHWLMTLVSHLVATTQLRVALMGSLSMSVRPYFGFCLPLSHEPVCVVLVVNFRWSLPCKVFTVHCFLLSYVVC